MVRDKPKFIGQHWGPLPFESEYSIFGRVCVLNRITIGSIQRCTYFPQENRKTSDMRRLSQTAKLAPFFTSSVLEETAGHLDPISSMEGWGAGYFEDALCFCPFCVAALYHSGWHQLKGLERCPIHGSQLRFSCERCGGALQCHGVADPSPGQHPYRCPNCLEWICSHDPSLTLHVALRNDPNTLVRAFAPLEKWRKRHLQFIHQIRRVTFFGQPASQRIERWWPATDMYFRMSGHIDNLPPGCEHDANNPERAMTWLCWPVTGPAAFNSNHDDVLTYMALLSQIREWIVSEAQLPSVRVNRWHLFDDRGRLHRGKWPASALAYALIRYVWEGNDSLTVHSELQLRAIPFSPLRRSDTFMRWNVHNSDLSTQAVLLGQFAAFFWSIKQLQSPTYKDFVPTDTIIARFIYDKTWPWIGNVIFPAIEGLPLGRFENPQVHVKDGLELFRWAERRRRSLDRSRFRQSRISPFLDED
jgi:hypothetical protein